jgi:hypothetical protein
MKDANKQELPLPPTLDQAASAMEMARIWIVDGHQDVVLSPNLWPDSGAWGLMLVDIARHVASAYAQQRGQNRTEVLKRIREAFDGEWSHSTDKGN